jgi:hypothetical protein
MIGQTTCKMHRLSLQLYQVRKRKLEGSMNQMFMEGDQSYVLIPKKEWDIKQRSMDFRIVWIIQQALLAKNDLLQYCIIQ